MSQSTDRPHLPLIDAEESERCAHALREARASVELEGFELPAECAEDDRRFVTGELSDADHTAEYLSLARLERCIKREAVAPGEQSFVAFQHDLTGTTAAGVSRLPQFSRPLSSLRTPRPDNETFEGWTARNVKQTQQMEHDEELRRRVAEYLS